MAVSIQIPADIARLNRKWSRDFSREYGTYAKGTGSVRFAFLLACEKHEVEIPSEFVEELINWREAEGKGLDLQPPEMLTSVFQARMFLESRGHEWTYLDDGLPVEV